VAKLPARRTDRGRYLCARRGALELVDCCNHAHGRSLGFDVMGIANDLASLDATAQAELVAGFGRVDVLVRLAAQLEAAQPWASRRPPVSA
jgi:hypothetical protein